MSFNAASRRQCNEGPRPIGSRCLPRLGLAMAAIALPMTAHSQSTPIEAPLTGGSQTSAFIHWGPVITIADPPLYKDAGRDARLDDRPVTPGNFGADFPRAIHLSSGRWLCVYTSYSPGDTGYRRNPGGGTRLFISKSDDNGKTWMNFSMVSDPGRDLDNGQFIQLENGSLLLSARSVRWQESYRLPVYRSTDGGKIWTRIGMIDANEGAPGTLGKPDRGVYEPFLYSIDRRELGVMYSSEKYAADVAPLSQIIVEKVSLNRGASWGPEMRVTAEGKLNRPGMPVWTRMRNGTFIVVYELCGPQHCSVYSKISADGVVWPAGLGNEVPGQRGAPYVVCLADGRLIVTSNNHAVSISRDDGATWTTATPAFQGPADVAFFSSLYPMGGHSLLILTGLSRSNGGRRIVGRIGTLGPG